MIERKERDFRDRNLVFVDLETTGLIPDEHEIIELGCVVVDGKSLDVVSEYESKIKPRHIETATPEALRINGYNQEDWEDARDIEDVLGEFNQISPGGVLIGWNVAFDWSFLRKVFDEQEVRPNFDYHRIDAMSIAYALLYNDEDVTSLSMRSIAPKYEIEMSEEHGALEDAMATYLIFRGLVVPRWEVS